MANEKKQNIKIKQNITNLCGKSQSWLSRLSFSSSSFTLLVLLLGHLDSAAHSPASFGPPRGLDAQHPHSRNPHAPPHHHGAGSFGDAGLGHPRTPLSQNYEPLPSPQSNASSAYQIGTTKAATAVSQQNIPDQRLVQRNAAPSDADELRCGWFDMWCLFAFS